MLRAGRARDLLLVAVFRSEARARLDAYEVCKAVIGRCQDPCVHAVCGFAWSLPGAACGCGPKRLLMHHRKQCSSRSPSKTELRTGQGCTRSGPRSTRQRPGRRGGRASGLSRKLRTQRQLEAKVLESRNGAAAVKLLEIVQRRERELERERLRLDRMVCDLMDDEAKLRFEISSSCARRWRRCVPR